MVPSWVAEARASADRVALVTDAGLVLPEGVADPSEARCELRLTGVRHGPLDRSRPAGTPGRVRRRGGPPPADAEALVKLLAVPDRATRARCCSAASAARTSNGRRARRLLLVEPHHADLFTGTIADQRAPSATTAPT